MPGTLVITTLSDGTNSTSATNAIQGSAKAWAVFIGANGNRNASYNTSSVVRNATGNYTVNFNTPLPNANYSVVTSPYRTLNTADALVAGYFSASTTSVGVYFCGVTGTAVDPYNVSVAVFQ